MAWDDDKSVGDVISAQDWDDKVSVIKKNSAVFNTSSSILLEDTEWITLGRIALPSNTDLKVHASGLDPSDTTDLDLKVRNVTDSSDIYTDNSETNIGPDLDSGGEGDTVEIRIENNTGEEQNVKGWAAVEVSEV